MLLSAPVVLQKGNTSLLSLVRRSIEPTLVVLTLVLSCLVFQVPYGGQELVLSLIAFSLTFPGEVSVRRLRRSLAPSILINWAVLFAVLGFLGYATRFIAYFDIRVLGTWFVVTPAVLYAAHRAIPVLLPQLLAIEGVRTAVVVAANDAGRRLARSLVDEPSLGYRFIGFFDDRGPEVIGALEGPLLGSVSDAAANVRTHAIETVFIALPMAAQPRVMALLDELKDTTASVYFVPDIFIADLIQARIDEINGLPVLAVCETPFSGVNGAIKRAADFSLSTVLVAVLSPLLLAIAIGVRMSSPGPIIFRQRRYGLDGREITVLKFRTMTVAEDGVVVPQATRDDRRVTRFGRLLRATSFDELPQLFNVLRGDMSLVGPRPHAVAHNESFRRLIKGYMMRHKVKPGITGWAQVNGLRGETDTLDKMKARIEYDLDYLRRWSLQFDLLILARTAWIVMRRTNAY